MTSLGALVFSSVPGVHPSASLLQAHVRALRHAHVREIGVVQPPQEFHPGDLGGVQVVLQPAAWNDPFDALVLGIFALNTDALLVLPGENALVSDATMSALVAEARQPRDGYAVVPICRQRRCYPIVLFRPGVEAVVREAARPQGLRFLDALLTSWGPRVRTIAVADDALANPHLARA